MILRDVAERLGCTVCCGPAGLETEVTGGYCGDLLSDVIAHAAAGEVWVTVQVHVNIVAVAVLKELAAIIVVNGRAPAEETLARGAEEKVPILTTGLPAFRVCGELHRLGVGGVTGC
jgi:predicted transcriptional regulator